MKTEIRNLNINCQSKERLDVTRDTLEKAAKLLDFDNIHEMIRWLGTLQPEVIAAALSQSRIDNITEKMSKLNQP